MKKGNPYSSPDTRYLTQSYQVKQTSHYVPQEYGQGCDLVPHYGFDQALQDTAARSFDLSISTDVDLPAGLAKSTGRGARFVLEEGKHGHLRPRIDFALSSYHTKLYLRRKGSTDPKELFSVTIKDGEWQVRDVEGNKIHLGIGQNGKPHLRKNKPVMEER